MPDGAVSTTEAPVVRHRRFRFADRLFRGSTMGVALGLAALLVLMIVVLASSGSHTFARFGFGFFTGRVWNSVPGREQYGALAYIYGTVVTSAIALVLAVPVAIGLALLLNEAARGWFAAVLATFVDLLAAIPSIVYGLWGLFVLVPWMENTAEPFLHSTLGRIPVIGALFSGSTNHGGFLAAGVVLAIMILPIITAVSREVVAVVPRELREAAMGLGATRYESIRMAVLPYARSGIVGATMLGLGRALGETIAVVLVIGSQNQIHASLFAQGYTIPAVIANEFREASLVGLHRSALLALALILMAIALGFAALSRWLVRRSRNIASGPAAAREDPHAVSIAAGPGVG